MKKLSIATLLVLSVVSIGLTVLSHTPAEGFKAVYLPKKEMSHKLSPGHVHKLKIKAPDAKAYAKKNNFNSRICLLIDMSLPSHQKRFFVYDLKNDSVLNSGLVTHGNCNQGWLDGRKYSNEMGCGCTSLGKYKVGYSYTGRFGLAFKLYGLERTEHSLHGSCGHCGFARSHCRRW